jgi:hypothetical protein
MEERGIAVGFVARRDTEGPIPPDGEEAADDDGATDGAADGAAVADEIGLDDETTAPAGGAWRAW